MSKGLTQFTDERTFAGFPPCHDISNLDADMAFIGVPYTMVYPSEGYYGGVDLRGDLGEKSAGAPDVIRIMSQMYRRYLEDGHYDYDFGGEILAGRKIDIYDCGNVVMDPDDDEGNRQRAEEAIRTLVEQDIIPIAIGGDHATTIPVLTGCEKAGPLVVAHIDAHIDFRDEIDGVKHGYSSPMRRASEMDFVEGIIHLGLRGCGSARTAEAKAAEAYGSIVVGAHAIHTQGVDAALEKVPQADRYYISLDTDGLDPAIAPGVCFPAPGGLTYYQATDLIRGIAKKGKIVGFDLVELTTHMDPTHLTGQVAAMLVLNLISSLAYEGHIGTA